MYDATNVREREMPSAFDNLTESAIFAQRDALADEYIPTEIVGRDEKKEEYINSLLPVYKGENPDNVFLYGQNGVGKTAVTHWVLNQLRSSENLQTEFQALHINCEGINTSYQLTIELANQLIPNSEDYLPSTGHPESKVYSVFFEQLDEIGGTALIVLDEIDHVANIDTFLYKTTRAGSYGDLSETKLGLIGISTDTAFGENLSSDVRSSLRERVIEFPPYDATQLEKVLSQRVKTAFYDDVVTDGAISYAAAMGSKNSGDARMVLDLVRIAGDYARERGKDHVTEELIKEAMDEYETQRSLSVLADLPENIKTVVYALAVLEERDHEEITSSMLYERYTDFTQIIGQDPVSERRARDYYGRLDELNILDSQVKHDSSGGQYKVHSLNHSTTEILSALSDTVETIGVHKSVEEMVDQ
ncbi:MULTISPECIES: Cdc6/Cdc18 family protein [Halococcus]|uniref:ORC1-type DNA replication protein n=1 Tax=Halococcus saccharolyticus DSM 5350 TaxID=1227455 RepID=M0MFU6_9EURY|nr:MULTISPECIES: AAA family ATPase [Halococcus]EMA43544.1 cell division control protein 6 [Halococcus saccharolyticus DSM 5350]